MLSLGCKGYHLENEDSRKYEQGLILIICWSLIKYHKFHNLKQYPLLPYSSAGQKSKWVLLGFSIQSLIRMKSRYCHAGKLSGGSRENSFSYSGFWPNSNSFPCTCGTEVPRDFSRLLKAATFFSTSIPAPPPTSVNSGVLNALVL